MSGRIVYRPDTPHPCAPPLGVHHPTGTLWQCDDCGDVWTALNSPTGATGWMREMPNLGIPESEDRAKRWPVSFNKEDA